MKLTRERTHGSIGRDPPSGWEGRGSTERRKHIGAIASEYYDTIQDVFAR